MACKPRTGGQRVIADVVVDMLVIADMGVDGILSDIPEPRWRYVASNVSCAGALRALVGGDMTWTTGVTCE